jgi:hypothetical protein
MSEGAISMVLRERFVFSSTYSPLRSSWWARLEVERVPADPEHFSEPAATRRREPEEQPVVLVHGVEQTVQLVGAEAALLSLVCLGALVTVELADRVLAAPPEMPGCVVEDAPEHGCRRGAPHRASTGP